ncbi:MAG: DUF4143 domain-containing protein, partial [Candidatus Moranbacteria bacterium]|nr:DUF4143 domain-containing protein [Candidatus Moranbacteria bacterium]
DEKRQLLHTMVDHYLFKDILVHENIRKSDKLLQILKLIAFQIGKDVSLAEIATALGINTRTVERYLDLLEKVFVIKRISGFSRNLRKEVTKSHRYYFIDNGVRNAVINNFNPLDTRDDVGQLWENYLVTERLKAQAYRGIYANNYFWRTYDQKEIDWIEEREGRLFGYEIKWNPKRKMSVPRDFMNAYPDAGYEQIDQSNYRNFICPEH